MIRLIVTADEESQAHMRRVLDYWGQLADIVADEIWDMALGAFTARVGRIFAMEGDPAWPPLSATTIRERAMVGYGPDPILERGGALRQSLTVPNLGAQMYVDEHVWFRGGAGRYFETHRTGNQMERAGGAGNYSFRFATLDDRFRWLSEGGEEMPGRDMVPVGGQRQEVGQEAERHIIAKMKSWANPDG